MPWFSRLRHVDVLHKQMTLPAGPHVRSMTQLGIWRRLVSSVLRATPVAWRGKFRVARWLLRVPETTAETIVHTRWGAVCVPSLRESISFVLLIDGVYEPESVRFLEQSLSAGGCFIDVGANVGFLTLVAARRVGAQGRILSVEASERICRYLVDNVSRNRLTNVVVQRCAAVETDRATREFYEAPPELFGKGSLAPQYYQSPTLVPTRTLDSLVEEAGFTSVDVLKIDVEGFEAAVLRGARRLLAAAKPPWIVFEFEDWSEARAGFPAGCAQDILLEHGYRIARLSDWLRNGTTLDRPMRSGEAMMVGVPPLRGDSAVASKQ